MKTFLWLGAALALLGLAVAAALVQHKHSARAEDAASRKRDAVLAEIKELGGHEWAGEYFAGDGRGVNVSFAIAPKSGFVFEWHGCLGLYDRNYGAVTWKDGRIHLAFTFENDREGFQGIASEFVPVPWGPRHYLIPGDDIVGFCNEVNCGSEPREGSHGSYLLRRGDEKLPVTGVPTLPREYQDHLLPTPIEAAIIAVGDCVTRPSVSDFTFKDTPVTIDAGARQGLRVGMELFVTTPVDMVESIKIAKVEETRSKAIMIGIGEDDVEPEAGWRLSTRAPWNSKRP